ncbi:SGNH/GDSL hydrolase family protein [Flavobacterium faecale]|uniref:SGNH/GDSL hydrolase family protein n=1 Tax=Flavobacterium faecale TaxID=1355330 RepID=UPI003AACFF0C
MKEQAVIQDWPYLNKYRKENTLISEKHPTANRIIFMGDSITEFWKNVHPDFFEGKNYINRGISGQTTPQMLIRFRADVIELKPTAVVILAGGNDIAGNTGPSTPEMIMNNLISMVELAKANQIQVILCSVLPANYFYWNPKEKPANTVIALNKQIKEYACAHNILYADYYSALVDEYHGLPTRYSADGVHPNKNGYLVMGPIIEKIISLV